jgi:hypothetical protein
VSTAASSQADPLSRQRLDWRVGLGSRSASYTIGVGPLSRSLVDSLNSALANVERVWLSPDEWRTAEHDLCALRDALSRGDTEQVHLTSRRLGQLSSSLFTPIESQTTDSSTTSVPPSEYVNHLVSAIRIEIADAIVEPDGQGSGGG